ncbi:hypothetical protein Shyhy01_20170 [Streptomyces hygroscopicus subsp. hygroscopicus]|nr:hypothetical protein [Streptomyces hygroscopicus]GLX49067.1 hypothetical protein Shyhy01_20170 [Streptomyces hygroscopicus subsp. hygroscopicus]
MPEDEPYCPTPERPSAAEMENWRAAPGEPTAECVLCREPTEYRYDVPGLPLCPRCEWQEAQRSACSG